MSNNTPPSCYGNENFFQCGFSLPSGFCCPTDATCQRLAIAEPFVLCCPYQEGCNQIAPVHCDANQFNGTGLPETQAFGTDSQALQLCGHGCCPPTYECQGTQCVFNKSDVATTSGLSTIATSASRTETSLSQIITSATRSPSTSLTASGDNITASGSPRLSTTTQALIGILAVVAICLILGFGSWYLLRRHKKKKALISDRRVSDLASRHEKAELDGTNKIVWWKQPTEMDAAKSPRELPALRSPRELHAETRRPASFNSILDSYR